MAEPTAVLYGDRFFDIKSFFLVPTRWRGNLFGTRQRPVLWMTRRWRVTKAFARLKYWVFFWFPNALKE